MTTPSSGKNYYFATVLVIKDWHPTDMTETVLPIQKNELIDVQDTETIDTWQDDTWWFGTKVGKKTAGWFPAAFTKLVHQQQNEGGWIKCRNRAQRQKSHENLTASTGKYQLRSPASTLKKEDEATQNTKSSKGSFNLELYPSSKTAPNCTAAIVATEKRNKEGDLAGKQPFRLAMRALKSFTGRRKTVACDTELNVEATMASTFNVKVGDILLVDTMQKKISIGLNIPESMVICRNVRTGEAGWMPYAFLQAVRPGILKCNSSNIVADLSNDILARYPEVPIAAPDWILHHRNQAKMYDNNEKTSHSTNDIHDIQKTQIASEQVDEEVRDQQDDTCSQAKQLHDDACDLKKLQTTLHMHNPSQEDEWLNTIETRMQNTNHNLVEHATVATMSQPNASDVPLRSDEDEDSLRSTSNNTLHTSQNVDMLDHYSVKKSTHSTLLRDGSIRPRSKSSSSTVEGALPYPNKCKPFLFDPKASGRDVKNRSQDNVNITTSTESSTTTIAALLSPPHRTQARERNFVRLKIAPNTIVDTHSYCQDNDETLYYYADDNFNSVHDHKKEANENDGFGDDTSYAWSLQRQEVARVHGTAVAGNDNKSQRILDDFLNQNSPASSTKNVHSFNSVDTLETTHETQDPSNGGDWKSNNKLPVIRVEQFYEKQDQSRRQDSLASKAVARQKSDMECIICCDKLIDTALYPCWHIICCSDCAAKVTKCPQCRRKIKFRQRVFIK